VQSYIQFLAEESSPQYGGACIFLGNKVEGSEGTYTFKWKVVTDQTDSVDVQFSLTPDAGIDFTYFMIDNGDAPDVQEARPVAYLYDGSLDEDYAYIYLSGAGEKFALTEINVAETTATADSLTKYDAVVVSPTIGADNAYLPVIRQAIAYVPMLNLNPYLYEPWGVGKAVEGDSPILGVLDREFAGFEGIELDSEIPTIELLTGGNIVGVELGEYFAADAVLATAGDPEANLAAMHIHNKSRNAYALLPLPLDVMPLVNHDVISLVVPQTLEALVSTKRDITATGTPVISTLLEDGHTTVSLSASNSKAIYYTTDGSEPTVESTLYTEPFVVYQNTTVKALATGDGYTPSKIAEKKVVVKIQASTPTVTIESNENGKAVVTMHSPQGIDMYFNFNGATTTALSQHYTEPIEITEPVTMYTIAEGGDWLTSELGEAYIDVNGFNGRKYELAHFDANQADWLIDNAENGGEGNASAYYYWGKSAWSYYSDELDHEETVTGSEGQDSIVYVYKPDANALRVVNPVTPNGWVLKSRGQVLTGELTLAPDNGVGNGATGRFAEEAIDFIGKPSKGVITFGAKLSGEPYTATIETTEKLPAPFDVVVFCGNGNNGSAATMEVQTSADGENWNTIGQLKMAGTQRYIKRTRLSVDQAGELYLRVAHVGGATKSQVYDIIVLSDNEELGISDMMAEGQHGELMSTELFTIGGMRVSGKQNGMVIVRKTYADGTVKTQKVLR
jgi:hypothetical protein